MTSNEAGLAICLALLMAALPAGVVTVALQRRFGDLGPGAGPTGLSLTVMGVLAATAVAVVTLSA